MAVEVAPQENAQESRPAHNYRIDNSDVRGINEERTYEKGEMSKLQYVLSKLIARFSNLNGMSGVAQGFHDPRVPEADEIREANKR